MKTIDIIIGFIGWILTTLLFTTTSFPLLGLFIGLIWFFVPDIYRKIVSGEYG